MRHAVSLLGSMSIQHFAIANCAGLVWGIQSPTIINLSFSRMSGDVNRSFRNAETHPP
jgi:hypothetical protein